MRPQTFRTLLIVGAAAAALSASSAFAATPALSAAKVAAIDADAQKLIAEHQTVGLVVGVMRHGQMLLAKGYGQADLENPTPVGADTVFRIASTTKQFTAASILVLVEQGKLSLNDKLSKFYPTFPRGDEVTIRQLLTHTSGITDYAGTADYWAHGQMATFTTEQFVDYIAHLDPPFYFEPGTGWSYDNSGYYLLGAIVEKVSGEPLNQFFDEHLFQKAGMHATAVDTGPELVAHRARGYEEVASAPGTFENTKYISITTVGGAGALRSTVEDLAKWQHALFAGQIITPASLKQMLAPGMLSNGKRASTAVIASSDAPENAVSGPRPAPKREQGSPDQGEYGFGIRTVRIGGDYRVRHGGSINGFQSSLDTFPDDDLTIVVLANTSGGGVVKDLVTQIRQDMKRPD